MVGFLLDRALLVRAEVEDVAEPPERVQQARLVPEFAVHRRSFLDDTPALPQV